MRLIYTTILYACIPLFIAHLLWRGRLNPAYRQRWRERFGFGEAVEGAQVIWLHAVSVGEVQASLPLVRLLQVRFPDSTIVVTTTTPTGRDRVRNALGDSVVHRYMPYDLPGAVNRFLDRINPHLVIIVETELWPNLFHYCDERTIPLALVNLRLSQRSALGYARATRLVHRMLSHVDLFAVQTDADAARLQSLGAPQERVHVTGSIKFDANLPASIVEEGEAMRRVFGTGRSVFIAASTHEGEDEIVFDAFRRIRERVPACLLVVVPRHPERFAKTAALSERRGYRTTTRTAGRVDCQDVDVFIGDTMGELPVLYAASDVSFVGGSLVPVGGHNLLEPAALSLPILVGPHTFNFAEISARLRDCGVCREIENAEQLADVVVGYLRDANLRHRIGHKARDFVLENRGAGVRVMKLIESLIPAAPDATRQGSASRCL